MARRPSSFPLVLAQQSNVQTVLEDHGAASSVPCRRQAAVGAKTKFGYPVSLRRIELVLLKEDALAYEQLMVP